MVVYLEVVLLSNFFIDIFIFSMVLTVLKSQIHMSRLIISSVIGSVSSATLPFIWEYANLCKILLIILLPCILKKNKTIKEYSTTLAIFLTITLFLGGIAYLLKNCLKGLNKLYIDYGLIPILFSISGILSIYLIHFIRQNLDKQRNKNENVFKVQISDGINSISRDAYFDSGNRVYANNGEPVSIVSKKIYNLFKGKEEEIIVQTIGGYVPLRYKMVEIKIYSGENENIIYRTGIAEAPFLSSEYEVILHCDIFAGG